MPSKTTEVAQATKAASRVKKQITKKTHRIRSRPRFFKPQVKTLARTPKYARRLRDVTATSTDVDKYSIILSPLNSEKASSKLENINTMTFLVDIRANKNQIREAFFKLYNQKVRSVRTLIT